MLDDTTILYQHDSYSVRAEPFGYGVYKDGVTAAVRVARIGWAGTAKGLARAIDEANRRAHADRETVNA
jgi:hypothetical protein